MIKANLNCKGLRSLSGKFPLGKQFEQLQTKYGCSTVGWSVATETRGSEFSSNPSSFCPYKIVERGLDGPSQISYHWMASIWKEDIGTWPLQLGGDEGSYRPKWQQAVVLMKCQIIKTIPSSQVISKCMLTTVQIRASSTPSTKELHTQSPHQCHFV